MLSMQAFLLLLLKLMVPRWPLHLWISMSTLGQERNKKRLSVWIRKAKPLPETSTACVWLYWPELCHMDPVTYKRHLETISTTQQPQESIYSSAYRFVPTIKGIHEYLLTFTTQINSNWSWLQENQRKGALESRRHGQESSSSTYQMCVWHTFDFSLLKGFFGLSCFLTTWKKCLLAMPTKPVNPTVVCYS